MVVNIFCLSVGGGEYILGFAMWWWWMVVDGGG